jgi:hypothetical protein
MPDTDRQPVEPSGDQAEPRNGKLSIPLPFDKAIRAALEVKPKGKVGNGKPAGKPRAKKQPK